MSTITQQKMKKIHFLATMIKRITVVFLSLLIVASCGNSSSEANNSNPIPEAEPPITESNKTLTGFNSKWRYMPAPEASNYAQFVSNVKSLKPQLIRYPGGTITHKWDWQNGQVSPVGTGDTPHPIEHLTLLAQHANVDVVFVLDIINRTVDDQIEMLKASNLPVKYIELGNEIYSGEYKDQLPSGKEYAERANEWVVKIRQQFPEALLSVSLLGRSPKETNARLLNWNQLVTENINNIDAFTYHIYVKGGVTVTQRISEYQQQFIPNTGKQTWITEYGIQQESELNQQAMTKHLKQLFDLAFFVESNSDIALNHILLTKDNVFKSENFSAISYDGSTLTPLGDAFIQFREVLSNSIGGSGDLVDSDADGVVNNADIFPADASESADSDVDGVGDNADVFPNDPSEWLDTDGDGIGNNTDVFPNDPSEWLDTDTDGDGIGNNSDPTPNGNGPDTDADGILNTDDPFPDDGSKPVQSSLWGAYGESWTSSGRLPFVAMAGYHEGKDPLPTTVNIVANVMDYGATNTEGSANDTTAFQAAIAAAEALVSIDNPGVILVPAGVYDLDKQLHLNGSGMILRGKGRDQSVLRFSTGVINDETAIGSDTKRRKLIVMGGNYDSSGVYHIGLNWQQWNSNFSAALDKDALPQRGDFVLKLANPLNATLKQNIIDQGYRIRLGQPLDYGEGSTTPELAASIIGGPDYAPQFATGGVMMSQQFVVSISADDQTLTLDRPLRFTPSNETKSGGVRIAVRDISVNWETQEIGVEELTIQLPATDWVDHFGIHGQGGIDINSDNSWVKNVKLINADNGIESDKKTFNNTISGVVLSGTRVPKRSGPAERRYDAYGHHGLTLKGRDQMLQDFVLEVSYVHDVTFAQCQGCVVMRGQAPQMNMDHHRQVVYDTVWTELNLGIPHRMWIATGNPSEGYNSAAYNTYWNIISADNTKAYWPENVGSQPQWGYHKINIVAVDGITSKPLEGEGDRPAPYHPDNAHLENMSSVDVWPENIYEAQLKSYRAGALAGMETPALDY